MDKYVEWLRNTFEPMLNIEIITTFDIVSFSMCFFLVLIMMLVAAILITSISITPFLWLWLKISSLLSKRNSHQNNSSNYNKQITKIKPKNISRTNQSKSLTIKDLGVIGEQKVIAAIVRTLTNNDINYRLINNFFVPNSANDYTRIAEIDHLLITNNQIYSIETKWLSLVRNNQYIFGDSSDSNLEIYYEDSHDLKRDFLNPKWQNQTHIKYLKNYFADLNIDLGSIHNIVIIKDNFVNFTTGDFEYYDLEYFIKFLLKKELIKPKTSRRFDDDTIQKINTIFQNLEDKQTFYQDQHASINEY